MSVGFFSQAFPTCDKSSLRTSTELEEHLTESIVISVRKAIFHQQAAFLLFEVANPKLKRHQL